MVEPVVEEEELTVRKQTIEQSIDPMAPQKNLDYGRKIQTLVTPHLAAEIIVPEKMFP